MSELKTNQIATNDGNNVAIDNSLNLKSYTTTQRCFNFCCWGYDIQ